MTGTEQNNDNNSTQNNNNIRFENNIPNVIVGPVPVNNEQNVNMQTYKICKICSYATMQHLQICKHANMQNLQNMQISKSATYVKHVNMQLCKINEILNKM